MSSGVSLRHGSAVSHSRYVRATVYSAAAGGIFVSRSSFTGIWISSRFIPFKCDIQGALRYVNAGKHRAFHDGFPSL